jgi:hypothetical protein
MKLFALFLLFSKCVHCQTFGEVKIMPQPSPAEQKDMRYYNWYRHPEENNIFIKNFELNLDGFIMAFSEAEKLLTENDLDFSEPSYDSSKFHPEVNSSHTFEDLHESISENKSKILRTWNVDGDYLSLLLKNDVYMLILGNKRAD